LRVNKNYDFGILAHYNDSELVYAKELSAALKIPYILEGK